MGGNDNRGAAVADIPDQFPQTPSCLRIQPGSGFIQENDPRFIDQRGGNRKTLFLPATEFFDLGLRLVFQIHFFQQFHRINILVV